ncbi:MAG: exodeoxyribonuclease VII small subunit [Candidatus Desantisbacteria bacterium]
MKFEEAIKRLEEIVRILEKGEVSLDDSLSLFEEGVSIRKFCSKRLSEAEKKIKVITEEEEEVGSENREVRIENRESKIFSEKDVDRREDTED